MYKRIRCIVILLVINMVGCFSNKASPPENIGQLVHQNLICDSPENCKRGLETACPRGGVLHKIRPVLLVQYNCN